MDLTKDFTAEEFASKDGSPTPPDVLFNLQLLANQLQVLRDFINEPIHINSGYRSTAHNTKIGGKPKSQHLLGKAADITTKNFSPEILASKIAYLIQKGDMLMGGLHAYPGFVHYDIRGKEAKWD